MVAQRRLHGPALLELASLGPASCLPNHWWTSQPKTNDPPGPNALRPPFATMPTPTGSPLLPKLTPEEQEAAACNGSNKEQQCGDEGCGGGGGDPLPAAAAVPPPGTVCIKCRKQEAEVSTGGMHIVRIGTSHGTAHSSTQLPSVVAHA